MIRTLLLASGLILGTGAAVAQDRPGGRLTHISAGTLQGFCQSPQTLKICDAYLSGLSDGVTLVESAAGPGVARDVCVAQPVTAAQLRSVLIGWLKQHPEAASKDAGPVTYAAYKAIFPCKDAGGAGGKP